MRPSKKTLLVVFALLWTIQVFQARAHAKEQVQKPLDLSGLWTMHFSGIETNCQDESKNGPKQGKFVFELTQQDDTLSATWLDRDTTNILTGHVHGTMVEATVYGLDTENCRVRTDITAEVTNGSGLVGRYSGQELNCETCVWEGELTVVIQNVPKPPVPEPPR